MRALHRVLQVSLLASLAACAAPDQLVILHTNDFHGQITPWTMVPRPGVTKAVGGFQAVVTHIAGERRRALPGTVVWLTDGGDWFQGTPEGNDDQGWSLMACRNSLGYTAVAVGNHEYDFGEANLAKLVRRAAHPVLAANVRDARGVRRPYVEPYRILKLGRVRVAIVGLVTSDTKNVSTGPFGGAEFGDEIATLRALLPKLKGRHDALVLLTHCGVRQDIELARTFPQIDLILGGHSHTPLPTGRRVGTTWIAQSAGRGGSLSRVEVDLEQDARRFLVRSVRLVALPRVTKPDPDIETFLGATFAHIGAKWDRPIGEIRGVADRRVRTPFSTPAGNYVADLMRRAAGADLGLTNKGGLRTPLEPGPITARQVFEHLPFDNTIFTVELTGVQLRTLLAQGFSTGRQPLEIAGGRYGFRVVEGVRRLAWVEVGGRRITGSARYRIATNSFLANGGDGFTAFRAGRARRVSERWVRDWMRAELREKGSIELRDDSRIRLVE